MFLCNNLWVCTWDLMWHYWYILYILFYCLFFSTVWVFSNFLTLDCKCFEIILCNILSCRYEVFTWRSILAALDHNFHLFRDVKEGYHKLYSKRSGNWRVEPVKAAKSYDYFTVLTADIMKTRAYDADAIYRRIKISHSHP